MSTRHPNIHPLRRTNRLTINFNQRELGAIRHYCNKYKIENRSKFIRETVISTILRKFESDYPTLFEFEDETPTLFSRV